MKPLQTTIAVFAAIVLSSSLATAQEKPNGDVNTLQIGAEGLLLSATESGAKPEIAIEQGPTGKAVVIIDRGGKKEAREVDLGTGENKFFVTSGGPAKKEPMTWLGVASDSVSPEIGAQLPVQEGVGLIVRHVVPESPAARAGLEVNDVLVGFGDQILTNPEQLRTLVRIKKEGESVTLRYLRKGHEMSGEAKLETKQLEINGTGAIELGAENLKVEELLNELNDRAATIAVAKQITVTPDGNVKVTGYVGNNEAPKLAGALKKALEELRKSGADEETIKKIEKVLNDADAEKMKPVKP